MTGKVLVASGTTNGSAAQIAEALAEVLRKDGHNDVRRFMRRYGKVRRTAPSPVGELTDCERCGGQRRRPRRSESGYRGSVTNRPMRAQQPQDTGTHAEGPVRPPLIRHRTAGPQPPDRRPRTA